MEKKILRHQKGSIYDTQSSIWQLTTGTGPGARHHHSTTRMGGDNKTRPLEKNPAVPGRSELDIYYTVYTVTIATCETSSINSEGEWARQRENNKQKSHQGFCFF